MKCEKRTVSLMIQMYCSAHHEMHDVLCPDCETLQDYAFQRIDKCPFGREKPVCNKCPVHCYRFDMKEQVKAVMRYSGPRMLLRHPFAAVRHLIASAKKVRDPYGV